MARIAGINIPQNKVVSIALTYIHGIGPHSSKNICEKLEIPASKRVNELSEEQVLKIREFIVLRRNERSQAKRDKATVSIKADKDDVDMDVIDKIENELREVDALRINYSTQKETKR